MSPRFKFKFDTVLRQRERVEQKEAKEFHAQAIKHEEEVKKLDGLKDKYKENQRELEQKKGEGIDINELKRYYSYMDSLKADIKLQQLRVKDAAKRKEVQRKKLVKAQKDKKVIDQLKENKFEEYKENDRRNEIKVIDDINSVIEARKRKS